MFVRTAAAIALSLAATVPSRGQELGVKQIKIIVPFPAGGTTDILARFVAQYFGEKL